MTAWDLSKIHGVIPTVAVGSHTPILMKDPVIRGTRSLLWQDVPIKPPRNASRGGAGNAGSCWTRPRCRSTTYKDCQQNEFMLCSLQWCVKVISQIWTRSKCSIITLEYSEMEPALQCRRQDCAPDSSSLKPGPGAIEGVLD